MTTYKTRLFYKPIVSQNLEIGTGVIEIKIGSEDYVIGLLKDKLPKCSKIIIEVKEE